MTAQQVQELFSPAKTELIEKGKNILSDAGGLVFYEWRKNNS